MCNRVPSLLNADRTLVMGVLNVTPDSFSDGGCFYALSDALARIRQIQQQGADLVDIGGESTRPGAQTVSVSEEIRRVVPVIREYLAETAEPLPVSVDTVNARTAAAALAAGASVVNDVSGGQMDPDIWKVVAEHGALYVCQHMRGTPESMDSLTSYQPDVVSAVVDYFTQRMEMLLSQGVAAEQIILDPGLGFAKTSAQSWQLLQQLQRLQQLGKPILIGASRKRFLAQCVSADKLCNQQAADRDAATTAVTTICADRQVWGVRVHNVAQAVSAVKVVSHWKGVS